LAGVLNCSIGLVAYFPLYVSRGPGNESAALASSPLPGITSCFVNTFFLQTDHSIFTVDPETMREVRGASHPPPTPIEPNPPILDFPKTNSLLLTRALPIT